MASRIDMRTIISAGSGKGGVGQSVVVSNLGHLLAKTGKRVLLADLDVGGADLHVMMGRFNPGAALTDFLNRKVRNFEEVLQPVETCPNLGPIPEDDNVAKSVRAYLPVVETSPLSLASIGLRNIARKSDVMIKRDLEATGAAQES